MKKNQFFSVYGGLFIVAAVLAAITVQTELNAGDCKSADALATMSRARAEACFSWDWD
jgi:hypothetical protein